MFMMFVIRLHKEVKSGLRLRGKKHLMLHAVQRHDLRTNIRAGNFRLWSCDKNNRVFDHKACLDIERANSIWVKEAPQQKKTGSTICIFNIYNSLRSLVF